MGYLKRCMDVCSTGDSCKNSLSFSELASIAISVFIADGYDPVSSYHAGIVVMVRDLNKDPAVAQFVNHQRDSRGSQGFWSNPKTILRTDSAPHIANLGIASIYFVPFLRHSLVAHHSTASGRTSSVECWHCFCERHRRVSYWSNRCSRYDTRN